MAKVAYTKIEHGKDDGTLVVIEEGDEVKGLPAEVAKQLGGEIKLSKYTRFEKGEGIEKKQDDFAAEVASMTK